MKFGPVPVDGGRRRDPRPLDRGFAGGAIRKGTVLGRVEIEKLRGRGPQRGGRGAAGPRRCPRGRSGRRGSPTRSPAVVCASKRPLPDARTSMPRRPVFWSSTVPQVDRLNRIDPAITVATLPEFAIVEPGRMVATVKIIPFAVTQAALDAAAALGEAIRVAPFRPMKVGLVATELPALKPSVMDKTRRLLEERVAQGREHGHRREARRPRRRGRRRRACRAAAGAGNDLLIVFGASAMVDGSDVVPAGIEAAGGIDPPSRHAGRSRQPPRPRRDRRHAGGRRAGLRAQPQGERLRLGAQPAARRHRRHARRHHRRSASAGCSWRSSRGRSRGRGRRRPASEDACAEDCGARPRGGPVAAHGRAEQAPRHDRGEAAGANRGGGGTREPGGLGHRRHRQPRRRGGRPRSPVST